MHHFFSVCIVFFTIQFRFLGVVTTYLSLLHTSPLNHKSLLLMNFWNTTWSHNCY